MEGNSSNVNPIALLFLLAMFFVTLRGSREAAVKALLAIAIFLPLGQQVVIGGIHFQFFRLLIIVGMIRILTRREARGFVLEPMDKLFLAWTFVGLIFTTIRKPELFMGADCLGGALNGLGTYFLIRLLLRDSESPEQPLRLLCFAAILIGIAMAMELTTHKNPFFVFGGVPETVTVRDGRLRCQGSFKHPIYAGTFAASLVPLLIGFWRHGGRSKMFAFVAMCAAGFSTLAAASSGAILTCLTAMMGFALWPMRYRMKLFRRGLLALVIGLSLVMTAPVWYLIAKLSDILGGTGWHRSYLIDMAVQHFNEWWMIGSSVTAHWAPSGFVLPGDPNNMDITNHYVAQGLQGGVLRLGLFIAIITVGFKNVGRVVRDGDDSALDPKLAWAFGVCLAAHCMAFISISYSDQIEVFWFWLLAMIATIPSWAARKTADESETQALENEDEARLAAEAVPA